MAVSSIDQPNRNKVLRVWPGVVAVALQWFFWFGLPLIKPEVAMLGMLGGVVCGLLVVVWWLFFSRALWIDRLGALVFMVLAVLATRLIVHPSISGGLMGRMIIVLAIPILSLALVLSAVVSRRQSRWPRRALLAGGILLGCAAMTLLRTGGITGEAKMDIHWRWTKTPEEKLLALANDEPIGPASLPAVIETGADNGWPGFRGAKRDGVARGVRIETDWSQKPPVEMWRRPIGPAWSSFAVSGDLFYTQEQRGENEIVSCYRLSTGQPVWRHRDAARFYESNAGAGPRGTPTLSNGRVYTFGATGIVNALDARTGSVFWSRNAASDTKTKTPGWGFTSSPLVVGDVVIVATAGALAAYDVASGNPKWFGPETDRGGYSSPQLATIGNVAQVLMVNGAGVIGVNPSDGKVLWKYAWEGDSITQPALTAEGDVLLGSGSGFGSEVGVLRLAVTQGPDGWTAKQRWLSIGLKPYFNDLVVHKDYAFGFDAGTIGCIDLKNGERKWKGAEYGHGQIVVLADQDLLLVISEEGDLALVKATPDQFTELARFKAIAGKTWNHPVLVGDILLVRNGEEMAAFRMTLAKS
ncbi:MAG: PQQ-binding-like beta-propeller repeat protein [Acidobacteriota bacterium]